MAKTEGNIYVPSTYRTLSKTAKRCKAKLTETLEITRKVSLNSFESQERLDHKLTDSVRSFSPL